MDRMKFSPCVAHFWGGPLDGEVRELEEGKGVYKVDGGPLNQHYTYLKGARRDVYGETRLLNYDYKYAGEP